MAKYSGPQLNVDWFGLENTAVNISDWRNGQYSHNVDESSTSSSNTTEADLQKRSNIVHAIIHNRSLEHLGSILTSGWDINETLDIPEHYLGDRHSKLVHHHYTKRTALGEAVRRGWIEGVRMLLEAGANCKMTGSSSNILKLALPDKTAGFENDSDCPSNLIKLLLEYGADPNAHNGELEHIPLFLAINHAQSVDIIKLLLEHGAKRNVIQLPPIHWIICRSQYDTIPRENLDIFYKSGGNVNIKNGDCDTALELAIREDLHYNKIKWLIRHGADISPTKVSRLEKKIDPFSSFRCISILVLLQAGGKVSQGVLMLFNEIQRVISTPQEDYDEMFTVLSDNWHRFVEAEEREAQGMQGTVRKSMFPDHLAHQMDDLEEFSDESLHFYPEEDCRDLDWWPRVLLHIHRIKEFLSQPKSLQWYCRCSVRDNLVSLQPSAVKTLPVAPILKRYILCHEI